MINIFVGIIDFALLLICGRALLEIYLIGIRHGVDIIASTELNEMEAGIIPIPPEWKEYVMDRRATIYKRDNEKIYQLWRKAKGLPEGSESRALFNDEHFRKGLDEQSNGS